MSKGNKRKDFKIPDPAQQLDSLISQQSKYKLGEKGYTFYDIRHLKPVFAFDYLSLNGTDLCFNSNKLDTTDFVGFLEGLKKISSISYNELKTIPIYRDRKSVV